MKNIIPKGERAGIRKTSSDTKGMSLKIKVISLFLAMSLIPLGIVGFMAYNNANSSMSELNSANSVALEHAAYNELEAVGQLKSDWIETFFEERLGDVTVLADSPAVVDAIKEIDEQNMLAQEEYPGLSGTDLLNAHEGYRAAYNKYNTFLTNYMDEYGYYDIFLICPEHGDVFYTSCQEADFGTHLSMENTGLAEAWEESIRSNNAYLTDTEPYAPSNGAPALFVAHPVKDGSETIGVVALQIGQNAIDNIMQKAAGMGESGETYLVGPDFLFRSNSRLSNTDTLLEVEVRTKGPEEVLQTHGTYQGVYGDYTSSSEASAQGRDYSSELGGVPVLGYVTYMDTTGWAVVAEMDASEAFEAVYTAEAAAETAAANLLTTTVLVIAVAAVAIALVGFLVTRSIVNPIQTISTEAKRMADTGDLSIRASVQTKDEIGQMATAINAMLDNVARPVKELSNVAETIAKGDLRQDVNIEAKGDINNLIGSFKEMTGKLKDLIGNIRQSAQETASAAEELSSSAEEVNASVEETSSTIQQIANGSSRTSQQTNVVLEETKKAGDAALKGKDSSGEVSSKMSAIKMTTQEGAEKIASLGDKSKEIGNIVNTINQISEQTNLLALNAAIEAARAGEAGRGFAVVADEVRKLAEESGQATKQISDLIRGIQGEIEAAVKSMDENTRQVEEGGAGVAEAVGLFEELPHIVDAVSKAAGEVASVAQENAAGSEEAASAMEQVSASMQQVTGSSQKLSELAEHMNNLVGQFKIDDSADFTKTNQSYASPTPKYAEKQFKPQTRQKSSSSFSPPKNFNMPKVKSPESAGNHPRNNQKEYQQRPFDNTENESDSNEDEVKN